jgi:V/A-type H+-transporting ATPase subunit K
MYIFLTLLILVVIATIAQGIIKCYKGETSDKEKIMKSLKINVGTFVAVMTALIISAIPQVVHAADGGTASGLGFIAAALAVGFSTIGAGYAVAAVGSSAIGAISENDKLLGKTLIFGGLAEGIAIYGLIIAIMILGRL